MGRQEMKIADSHAPSRARRLRQLRRSRRRCLPEGREYLVGPAVGALDLHGLEQEACVERLHLESVGTQPGLNHPVRGNGRGFVTTIPVQVGRPGFASQFLQLLERRSPANQQSGPVLLQIGRQGFQAVVQPPVRGRARGPVVRAGRVVDEHWQNAVVPEGCGDGRIVGQPKVIAEPDNSSRHEQAVERLDTGSDHPLPRRVAQTV